ncbi:MAG: phosphatidylethanolamine-binding protein [Benjaminiella poitrasii]|nr:MAG: phosphatidylethanolamine-binding protein [Benjaminiella poitrasii]
MSDTISADIINNTLKEINLIPDVIKDDFQPKTLLKISFEKNDKRVEFGNYLTPNDANERPKVDFVVPTTEEPGISFYTLVMTDPDAPSVEDKKFGPWRHWIVVNISGNDLHNSITKDENQHTPYIGPGPVANTGTHRYTFLLYKQLKNYQSFEPMKHEQREDRRKFKLREFESKNHLELVAMNFFCCPT